MAAGAVAPTLCIRVVSRSRPTQFGGLAGYLRRLVDRATADRRLRQTRDHGNLAIGLRRAGTQHGEVGDRGRVESRCASCDRRRHAGWIRLRVERSRQQHQCDRGQRRADAGHEGGDGVFHDVSLEEEDGLRRGGVSAPAAVEAMASPHTLTVRRSDAPIAHGS